MDRKHFYDSIRESLFGGELSKSQVAGLEAILNHYEILDPVVGINGLCYILATVYHETDKTIQPIEEYGKGAAYAYGKKLKYGNGPGKRIPYTKPDKIYFGRGLTQNTWFEIHEKLTAAAKKQGHDWNFLEEPELLLQMTPSVWATFYAMRTGLYTGHKLSEYFNDNLEDPVNARKIINPKEIKSFKLIAGYYSHFKEALRA